MLRTDSFEKTLCWERLKVEGERDDGGWDGWMASLTQWTWVSSSSRIWRWTGKPVMLQFMGVTKSQTLMSDWTEPNWHKNISTINYKLSGNTWKKFQQRKTLFKKGSNENCRTEKYNIQNLKPHWIDTTVDWRRQKIESLNLKTISTTENRLKNNKQRLRDLWVYNKGSIQPGQEEQRKMWDQKDNQRYNGWKSPNLGERHKCTDS